jgi:hypothetical protein
MVNKAKTSAFGTGSISLDKIAVKFPVITSVGYFDDDTAADTTGGQTITINGINFIFGCYVYIDTTLVTNVTFVSSNKLTFPAPARSAGTYNLYVYNPDGATTLFIPGISYSGIPLWSTPSGSIGTSYETVELSSNVTVLSASSDSTIKYRLYSGTLPVGATLNANTGAITGISGSVVGSTTYSFSIEAYDLENQGVIRPFSITISPDIVTWISPADGTTVTSYEYGSISQTLSASSATGKSISYTANTLPTGVSIVGNTISGTPSSIGTTNSLITANSATTNKTSTRNIKFQVNSDVVTWNSPADGTLINSNVGSSITQTLSASSAAGRSISYTANTLPAGLSISGSTITGTLSAQANTTSLITATSATTNRTSTRILLFYVKTVPNAPTIGTATISSTTASVAFTPPAYDGNSPITQYIATSSPGNITGTSTSSPISVSGLTVGTAYTFTVKAVNAAGQSSSSSSSNSVTPASVPSAPTIGTATATSATSASVTFTASASNGGALITSYTAVSSPGNITGTSSTSPITVNGLSSGTSYTFTVYATNSVGNSASSAPSNSIATTTVPGAPTIGTATRSASQTVQVSFTAPASNGGSPITSYTATSSPGGITGTLSQAGSGTITVSGLTNGTAYTFTVTATNAVGTGSASSASNSATPYTIPGAPTIGTATVASATSATVTFTAPGSNGGSAITSYTAVSSPGNITGTLSQAGSGTITVSGLTSGTSYTFTVYATNAAGNGSSSGSSNSITPNLSAPTTVELFMIGAGGCGGRNIGSGGGGGGAGGQITTGSVSVSSGVVTSVRISNPYPLYYGGDYSRYGTSPTIFGAYTVKNGGIVMSMEYSSSNTEQYIGAGGYGGDTRGPGFGGATAGKTGFTYNGGSGYAVGGGGAGAGGSGQNGNTSGAGKGGLAYTSSITGVSVEYGGGGGGGGGGVNSSGAASLGGAGGGGGAGAGATTNAVGAGADGSAASIPNRGSGGGGGAYGGYQGGSESAIYGEGGVGSSGVVIIAYPTTYAAPVYISSNLTYTVNTTTRSGYRVYTFTGQSQVSGILGVDSELIKGEIVWGPATITVPNPPVSPFTYYAITGYYTQYLGVQWTAPTAVTLPIIGYRVDYYYGVKAWPGQPADGTFIRSSQGLATVTSKPVSTQYYFTYIPKPSDSNKMISELGVPYSNREYNVKVYIYAINSYGTSTGAYAGQTCPPRSNDYATYGNYAYGRVGYSNCAGNGSCDDTRYYPDGSCGSYVVCAANANCSPGG